MSISERDEETKPGLKLHGQLGRARLESLPPDHQSSAGFTSVSS